MKMMKRTLAILLVLTLTCSMLATSVFAESYQETNTYVLNYNGVYKGAKWQYFSPYYAIAAYDGVEEEVEGLIAFNLYDTANGEGFFTYCTDIETGLNNNSNFRRINLEDSTYAAAGAGLLRSIVLKGYPNVSVEALGAAAGVSGLTVGEAVSATQAAIWQAAHGSRLEFTDFCSYIDTAWNPTQTVHYGECNAEIANGYASDENEPLIESHIQAVFAYLTSLEPTAPAGIAVSNNSFASWSDAPVLTKNEDGTYNVTVEATVDVQMKGSTDYLTLTAVLGDYSASTSLANSEHTKTLTIAGVPADQIHNDVILNIDGQQTVSDVFLFDAEGKRGSSQSLIGMLDNQLPVHAEVVVQAERVINIHKTGKGIPLEGIQFDVFFIADRSDYLSGNVDLPDPSSYENKKATYTIITDANGDGSLSLTKNNLPDGVYLVVEREHSAIAKPVDPFFVIFPATSPDGTHLEYVINVYPKNDVVSDVLIEKDVVSIDNNEASVDAAKPHTWIISASIPGDLANGKSYEISDTLDERLDYVGNSMKVQVESADGTTVYATLTSGVDYIADVEVRSEENPTDSFTVSLTPVGRMKVADAAADDIYARIRVYFDAQINSNAAMGEEIPNKAKVDYTNSVGVKYDAESDVPEVYTGGVCLEKVDASNSDKKLAGAVFQVYRIATAAEINDESVTTTKIGDMAADMVLVSFYNKSGDQVTEVASDTYGSFGVYGLAYGEYYLVETKAPAGYNLSSDPIKVTITGSSHLAENTIQVTNNAGATLPETGGMGTTIFYIVGGIMVVAAVVLLVTKKRMSAEG